MHTLNIEISHSHVEVSAMSISSGLLPSFWQETGEEEGEGNHLKEGTRKLLFCLFFCSFKPLESRNRNLNLKLCLDFIPIVFKFLNETPRTEFVSG